MTRLNYTGRKRITRRRVHLRISGEDAVRLDADVDLDGLALPEDALVVVEAYRQTQYERMDCGTVASPRLLRGHRLYTFDVPDGLMCRVKVVGRVGDDDGKLLAVADRLRPERLEAEQGRVPLLPVRPSRDLGQRLWRLDLGDEPVMEINAGVGDWKGFASDVRFRALVFPEVVRMIAQWIWEQADAIEQGDGSPQANWMRFLRDLGAPDPVALRDADGDKDDWADEAAESFVRRHRLLDSIESLLEGETEP